MFVGVTQVTVGETCVCASDRGKDMSGPALPGPGRLVAAGVALAVAVVVPLLVWTYARTGPELGGIPFFFWYQFVLVVVSVLLTTIAYRLVVSHENERRAAEAHARGGAGDGTAEDGGDVA